MDILARTISARQRPLKFAIVGLLNTGIDFVTFWALITLSDTPLLIANSIAYIVGIMNSFVCNKLWTFGDIEHRHSTHRQFAFTLVVYGIGLLVSNVIISIAANFLPAMIAKIVAIFGTVVWTYWASKKYVFTSIDATE